MNENVMDAINARLIAEELWDYLRQHIEDIEKELWRLEEERFEAKADGRTADAAAIESQIETLQNELDGIFHR